MLSKRGKRVGEWIKSSGVVPEEGEPPEYLLQPAEEPSEGDYAGEQEDIRQNKFSKESVFQQVTQLFHRLAAFP